MPRDERYADLLQSHNEQGGISIPSLFVAGDNDGLVSFERTSQLMSCFAPQHTHLYRHPGAHLVPTCSGEFKQTLVWFLDGLGLGASGSGLGSGAGVESASADLIQAKLQRLKLPREEDAGPSGELKKQVAVEVTREVVEVVA